MKNSPIFIVGSPRSGTTLLRLMLNRHSNIAIPEETWFFPDLQKLKYKLLNNGDNWRERVAGLVFKRTRFGFPDLSMDDILGQLALCDIEDWPGVVAVVNKWFTRMEGKQRWGDKTPGYVCHLPLMKALYPDANIIHIIRDGRDVVPSILKYWLVGPQTDSFIETTYYWKWHVSKGLKDGPHYFGSQYMEVKYEILVSEPESTLKRICDFIGEDFQCAMLDTAATANKYVPKWDWHKDTYQAVNSNRIANWRNEMGNYEKTIFQLACGSLISKLGYTQNKKSDAKAFIDFYSFHVVNTYKKSVLKIKVYLYRKIK